jgi:hypothetical protein
MTIRNVVMLPTNLISDCLKVLIAKNEQVFRQLLQRGERFRACAGFLDRRGGGATSLCTPSHTKTDRCRRCFHLKEATFFRQRR